VRNSFLHHQKHFSLLTMFAFGVVLTLNVTMYAQQAATANALAPVPQPAAVQGAAAGLSNLPESDTIFFMNPRRILTEAMPRVLPQKDVDELRTGLAALKARAGIDPQLLDFLVVQVRFRKPAADLSFSLPEFMMTASGDFDGATLMQLIREAAKGQMREEQYNSKTLNVMSIGPLAAEAQKTPILKSLSEVAIVLLNGNTIAVGTTAYVKAAVDAQSGQGRISADLLNSAMRDPTALIATAGSPLTAFAKTFALLGTENNPRPSKCDMKLGDYYGSVTMDATSFKIRGAMNADNPDTAKIIKSLLSMGLQAALANIKDSQAQSALRGLTITPTETEVLVQADISQQTVADFIRDTMAPKKQEAVTAPPAVPENKSTTPRRRGRRRPKPKP
jgi:hypothetical protein